MDVDGLEDGKAERFVDGGPEGVADTAAALASLLMAPRLAERPKSRLPRPDAGSRGGRMRLLGMYGFLDDLIHVYRSAMLPFRAGGARPDRFKADVAQLCRVGFSAHSGRRTDESGSMGRVTRWMMDDPGNVAVISGAVRRALSAAGETARSGGPCAVFGYVCWALAHLPVIAMLRGGRSRGGRTGAVADGIVIRSILGSPRIEPGMGDPADPAWAARTLEGIMDPAAAAAWAGIMRDREESGSGALPCDFVPEATLLDREGRDTPAGVMEELRAFMAGPSMSVGIDMTSCMAFGLKAMRMLERTPQPAWTLSGLAGNDLDFAVRIPADTSPRGVTVAGLMDMSLAVAEAAGLTPDRDVMMRMCEALVRVPWESMSVRDPLRAMASLSPKTSMTLDMPVRRLTGMLLYAAGAGRSPEAACAAITLSSMADRMAEAVHEGAIRHDCAPSSSTPWKSVPPTIPRHVLDDVLRDTAQGMPADFILESFEASIAGGACGNGPGIGMLSLNRDHGPWPMTMIVTVDWDDAGGEDVHGHGNRRA